MTRRIAFHEISTQALNRCPGLLFELLPGGKLVGQEYQVRNPRRSDRHVGSFSVNTRTGCWADFADNCRGRDLISLVAYLNDTGQGDAAKDLAERLGVEAYV